MENGSSTDERTQILYLPMTQSQEKTQAHTCEMKW